MEEPLFRTHDYSDVLVFLRSCATTCLPVAPVALTTSVVVIAGVFISSCRTNLELSIFGDLFTSNKYVGVEKIWGV